MNQSFMLHMRPQRKTDIPYRVEWLNNPKVNKFIGETLGQSTTLRKQEQWFEAYKKDKNKKFFTAVVEGRPIGMVGLSSISQQNRNADLFIVIGDDAYRGKGFGRKMMEWIIDYGFQTLGLHKINLGVIQDNKAAVKLYKALGFKVEGKMKDEVFSDGRYYDFLSMAKFRD